jgi:hypothetical protein
MSSGPGQHAHTAGLGPTRTRTTWVAGTKKDLGTLAHEPAGGTAGELIRHYDDDLAGTPFICRPLSPIIDHRP